MRRAVLLVLAAFALRAGWVMYSWQPQAAALPGEGVALAYDDERLHWQLATNLAHAGGLVSDDGRHAARMPLYPLFLGAFAGLGGYGILVARLVQAIFGAATVGIIYAWLDAAAGRRAGLVGGVLAACDPFAVFFANLLLTEVLFTLLLVGLCAGAWWVVRAGRPAWASWLGVAVVGALAVLTRPSVLALLPVLWVLVAWRARDWRVLLCPAALILLLLPWGLRNKAVLGSYCWLSSNGGVTLYDGVGPQADGSSNQAFLAELPELNGLGEVQRDRRLQHLAIEHMRQNPGHVVRLALIKLRRTWSPTPNVAEHRTGGAAMVGAAYTVVLMLGAVAGLVVAWRRHDRGAGQRSDGQAQTSVDARRGGRWLHVFVWLPIVYFTLLHCVYIGSVRYRVPLMPVLAAGAGAAWAVQRRGLVGRDAPPG